MVAEDSCTTQLEWKENLAKCATSHEIGIKYRIVLSQFNVRNLTKLQFLFSQEMMVFLLYCLEQMKADISVDTVQFILFLYIQQVHKISLRESLVGGEEYP